MATIDLRQRVPEISEDIAQRIVTNIDSFARAGEEYRPVVLEVVTRLVRLVVQLFREQRRATPAEIAEMVQLCLPPSEQGITLGDMLEVFALSQDKLWGELSDLVADVEIAPAESLRIAHAGVHLVTELSRGVTERYVAGDRVWLQRLDAERVLVRGVLGRRARPEAAARAAQALGLRLLAPWRVGVYDPRGADLDPNELRDAVDARRGTGPERGALAVLGRTVVLLQSGAGEPPPPPPGVALGVGRVREGVAGMRESHAEAAEAATAAWRRGVPRLGADDALVDRVLLGSLGAQEMVDRVLQPLAAEPAARREMLSETLEAWLDEGCSAAGAARRLSLHEQSVHYRLRQLREVLGDELDDADARLRLHLACKARRLVGSPGGPPRGPSSSTAARPT